MKKVVILVAVVCSLLFVTYVQADDPKPVPVKNAGFEESVENALAPGWHHVSDPRSIQTVLRDAKVKRSGGASMQLSSRLILDGTSITVASDPVKMEVGHLYRLSAWIKTEAAKSDPTTRYPTALPACVTMYSFPFTENSPAVGGNSEWTYVSVPFIATRSEDRVQLHLGRNGSSTGNAWFDDIKLEKIDDIGELIPMDSVRWFGPAYRYDDKGWIVVHIEGEPYERGYQYGYLLAEEIVQYMDKLAHRQNEADPEKGWRTMRFMSDAMMLRKYDEEYLTEMRGIADGANKAGVSYHDDELDLVDIVAVNSAIDLGQMTRAMGTTPHALTGRNFLREEEEMLLPDDYNKCSSFVATGNATVDGRFVFGQMFMWGGYTGVHWDVICDVVPSEGNRIVYHTFPGGIHSGADFYINSAGIVIGETTVAQTPYDAEGTPQSNRIRKALQYGNTFEEVRDILFEGNNGMYTNDWTMADAKTDEGGCLLLGTKKYKLWRTGKEDATADTPAGHEGYIWANNNNRDPDVRKEYIPDPENAPYDLIFRPANRDIAFQHFFEEFGDGKIDHIAAVNVFASSPINRAHACDGKITTGEMAERLVFLAHYGKTTLREKMVGERFIPDMPGAEPHMTLGYTAVSPIFITEKLQAARAEMLKAKTKKHTKAKPEFGAVAEALSYDRHDLWQNTVYPSSEADNWFTSATAAYWNVLRDMPAKPVAAMEHLRTGLIENNCRFQYLVSREGDLPALKTKRVYDRYNHYYIPRIKGLYALHQLRLLLGNEAFAKIMNTVHDTYAGTKMSTDDFIAVAEKISGKTLRPFVMQWLEREGLPSPKVDTRVRSAEVGYEVRFNITQDGRPYDFVTLAAVETKSGMRFEKVHVEGANSTASITVPERPTRVMFNPCNDIPMVRDNFYTMANFIDDFHSTSMVYGTNRQIEANHTISVNWCRTLADAYVEILVPVVKDCEISDEDLAKRDIILMGGPADNSLTARLAAEGKLPMIEFGRNSFSWKDRLFNKLDDGIVLVMPNPYNKDKVLYLFVANSALQLHDMTQKYHRGMATWTLFKGKEMMATGYDAVPGCDISISSTVAEED